MRAFTTFERLEPDTISGDKIKLTVIYSSWDSEEIDKLEKQFREMYGSGIVADLTKGGEGTS